MRALTGILPFPLLAILIPALAAQQVLKVPSQYKTIQAAIDAASSKDTVQVDPGTYVEVIDFKSKAIIVRSRDGAAVTTLDGNYQGSVVRLFGSGVIEGFTITKGNGTPVDVNGYGGGIYCGGSPTIRKNVITLNSTQVKPVPGSRGYGGGIYCSSGSPVIVENVISSNSCAGGYGGGILIQAGASGTRIERNTIAKNSGWIGGGINCRGSATISNNVISENYVTGGRYNPGAEGAGIRCDGVVTVENNLIEKNQNHGDSSTGEGGGVYYSNPAGAVAGNVIRGNEAYRGGGVYCKATSGVLALTNNTFVTNTADHHQAEGGGAYLDCIHTTFITNTVFWSNSAQTGPAIHSIRAAPAVTCSDIQGGWSGTGNISADPRFADAATGDLHLLATSPCIHAGSAGALGLPPTDFEGDPRIAYGTPDMGADEFFPHLYHTGNCTPGGTIQVKLIGKPLDPAFWAFSAGTLPAPVSIPGLQGLFHLDPGTLTLIPMGSLPSSGLIAFPIAFPGTFPRIRIPTQALLGIRLSNLDVADVK